MDYYSKAQRTNGAELKCGRSFTVQRSPYLFSKWKAWCSVGGVPYDVDSGCQYLADKPPEGAAIAAEEVIKNEPNLWHHVYYGCKATQTFCAETEPNGLPGCYNSNDLNVTGSPPVCKMSNASLGLTLETAASQEMMLLYKTLGQSQKLAIRPDDTLQSKRTLYCLATGKGFGPEWPHCEVDSTPHQRAERTLYYEYVKHDLDKYKVFYVCPLHSVPCQNGDTIACYPGLERDMTKPFELVCKPDATKKSKPQKITEYHVADYLAIKKRKTQNAQRHPEL
ncbi:unnamed protein product, partial [Mesorhabditis spiculigera]